MKRVFIIFLGLFIVFSVPVFADEKLSTESAQQQRGVEYKLAFPGILPTSPFYGIKMFRDRVVGYLIADPLKKAEFALLQADKRLQGGVFLLMRERGESELAISTISKGENYFEEAFYYIKVARDQKKDVYDLGIKMSLASLKHQEVLKSIEKSVPEKNMPAFKKEMARVEDFVKRSKSIKLR